MKIVLFLLIFGLLVTAAGCFEKDTSYVPKQDQQYVGGGCGVAPLPGNTFDGESIGIDAARPA